MVRNVRCVGAVLAHVAVVGAFMSPARMAAPRTRLAMAASGPKSMGESRWPQDAMVKDLLTVRAAQSMNFYSLEFHDETSVRWVEKYMNETDVTSVGSTQFLYRLMRTEPEEIIIKKMRQMPRGGSGNNPFLKKSAVAMEYPVLIDPMGIARKLMSVRLQIANEWAQDLQRIDADNREALRLHESMVQFGKDSAVRLMTYDADDPFVGTSSPYRAHNYMDLKRVLTAEAVGEAVSYLREARQTTVAEWLVRFADLNKEIAGTEFLEKMLATNVVSLPSRNGKKRSIEPTKVANLIMKFRTDMAAEWVEAMGQVQEDHTKIHAMMLEYQFRSGSEDVEAALAEQLREEYKMRRDKNRESLIKGAASWWEDLEDLELDES